MFVCQEDNGISFLHTQKLTMLPILQAVAAGFGKIYTEILFISKTARASLLQALMKRFEDACDLNTTEQPDLDLLYTCAQIAASLPLRKMYEVMLLLQPAVRLINSQGDSVLAGMKWELHGLNGGGSSVEKVKSCSRVCGAVVCLLLIAKSLVLRYGLTSERLAAFEVVERRKGEEQKDIQVQPREGRDCVGDARNIGSEDPGRMYEGLKGLLLEFGEHHSYLSLGSSPPAGGQVSERQGIPSPPAGKGGAATPVWASAGLSRVGSGKLKRGASTGKKGVGKVPNRRKSNLSRTVPEKGKRRKSGFVASESDDSEDEDFYAKPVAKRVAQSRRKLEANLSDG